MSYFQGVRLYAALESVVFSTLLVVWIGGLDDSLQNTLGWIHGFGWILLSVLVLWGWIRRIFPGPLLAATVSPAGPLGALLGFEVLVRRKRKLGNVTSNVPSERSERPDPVPDPVGSGPGGGAARGDA